MGKYSLVGRFSPSSNFLSDLLGEFDRDRILGFLVVFSFLVVMIGSNKLLGEFRGFEDDESDVSLLYVSFDVRNSVFSR